MPAALVVEGLEVIKDGATCIRLSLETAVVGEGLAFDGGKEALALGIVIVVALR